MKGRTAGEHSRSTSVGVSSSLQGRRRAGKECLFGGEIHEPAHRMEGAREDCVEGCCWWWKGGRRGSPRVPTTAKGRGSRLNLIGRDEESSL